MTKPTPPKKNHPAKTAKPRRKPVDGQDGFTGHVYEQRRQNWESGRDNPEHKAGE
jgi:hypothetical protein